MNSILAITDISIREGGNVTVPAVSGGSESVIVSVNRDIESINLRTGLRVSETSSVCV